MLLKGLSSLGTSGLQDREVCDDQELAGGRLTEAAAAWDCGLCGGVSENSFWPGWLKGSWLVLMD